MIVTVNDSLVVISNGSVLNMDQSKKQGREESIPISPEDKPMVINELKESITEDNDSKPIQTDPFQSGSRWDPK